MSFLGESGGGEGGGRDPPFHACMLCSLRVLPAEGWAVHGWALHSVLLMALVWC